MKFPTSIVGYLKTIVILAIIASSIYYANAMMVFPYKNFVFVGLIAFLLAHRPIALFVSGVIRPNQKYAFLALQPIWYILHLDHWFDDNDRELYRKHLIDGGSTTALVIFLFLLRFVLAIVLILFCVGSIGNSLKALGMIE